MNNPEAICPSNFFEVGGINMHLIRVHFKEDCTRGLFMMLMRCSFLIVFIKAYVVGNHLNCLDKSRQFKCVPATYDFIKK